MKVPRRHFNTYLSGFGSCKSFSECYASKAERDYAASQYTDALKVSKWEFRSKKQARTFYYVEVYYESEETCPKQP